MSKRFAFRASGKIGWLKFRLIAGFDYSKTAERSVANAAKISAMKPKMLSNNKIGKLGVHK